LLMAKPLRSARVSGDKRARLSVDKSQETEIS
jgi:hypothetical protein